MLVAAVFGYPAWVTTVHKRRDRRRAIRIAEDEHKQRSEIIALAKALARVLTGSDDPGEIPPTSTENPAIRDQLSDLVGQVSETAASVDLLREAFRHHISDHHGGVIPEWLYRR